MAVDRVMQALLPSLQVDNEGFEHRPTANGGGAVDLEQVLIELLKNRLSILIHDNFVSHQPEPDFSIGAMDLQGFRQNSVFLLDFKFFYNKAGYRIFWPCSFYPVKCSSSCMTLASDY